ncbi:hypothetical protein UA08_09003 [Talaromyces atroroseus]|uniref:Uncharacterized protein n=1 Tax=Talaromyces atroroseus TaxID=1441469 RepID=A0A1Q5Q7G9_TALAT|nr:hypothetical protein UA08_09003 [Talaromyces atroroseus]OKL55690.1 hypothetical protein UA08_09003 [Talaromyces atroroseus]
MPRVGSVAFAKLVDEWSGKSEYPNKHLDRLDFTENEYHFLIYMVYIAVQSVKDVCKFKAAQDVAKLVQEENGSSANEPPAAQKPQADINNSSNLYYQARFLPSSTKFYVTQEGNIDSRTPACRSGCSPLSLTFAKLTQILKKRGTFETPAKHQIFYYDPENPMMANTVDDSRSFRVGVEDMVHSYYQRQRQYVHNQTHREAPKLEIEFYVREKCLEARDAPPVTPSPSPKNKNKRRRPKSISKDNNYNSKKLRVHGDKQE